MILLENIAKKYRLDHEVEFTALQNINLKIKKGEFSAITGPSGSGKSTLMHIIGLLDQPSEGKILIEDKEISKLNDNELSTLRSEFVGFVFQQFNLINKLTVFENIMLPAIYKRKELNFDPKEKTLDLINKFNLKGKENSYPNKISGGQQQRVAIARAMIMNPKLILADEPTGNLDTKSGDDILDLLEDLNKKERLTVVIVTHEFDVAKRARTIIKLRDGQII